MHDFLKILADGAILSEEEAAAALGIIMRGEAAPEEIAAFLVGLRARGEDLGELVAFTRVMRECSVHVTLEDPHAVDLCGTGGDALGTFNISTAAAITCAGAGVTVAKHGNRSVSSRCGSADVLEGFGVKVELGKEGVERCLEEAGIAFLYAPLFHPAMRHVMPVRRKLGVRTFFNILGPLCNPAGVRRQLVGAFNVRMAQTMANILEQLEADHIVTAHSEDGMDEISLSSPTTIFEYNSADRRGDGYDYLADVELPEELISTKGRDVQPEDFGFGRYPVEALQGGTVEDNVRIIGAVLDGVEGPERDVVILNAAFGLHVSGKFEGMEACVDAARESIDSGAARERLKRLGAISNGQ